MLGSDDKTSSEAIIGELTLSNDPDLLSAAVAFVKQVAEFEGLGYRATSQLELAVAEAAANVIRHAFRPGERGSYTLTCLSVPGGLEVRVRDRGLPFVPDASFEPSSRRLGLDLMSRNVDQLSFQMLGSMGKEVRLQKQKDAGPSWSEIEAPAFHPQSFSADQLVVRDMLPTDAVEVSRCFYDVYGYGYGSDTVYDSRRLIDLNNAGLMKTLVAATPEGYVLGTESLERSNGEQLIYEAGMAAVRPEARHFGVGAAMTRHMQKFLGSERVPGVWAACVTSHTFSQRFLPPAATACALLPGNKPADTTLTEAQTQRNSVLYLYLSLVPKAPTPTLYLPEGHEDICRRIFEGFGWTPHYATPPAEHELAEITRASYDANTQRSRVVGKAIRYGKDFASRGRVKHDFFRTHGYAASYAFLPLTDPYTPEAVLILESWGYFFCGIFPGSGRNDPFVVLTFLNNQILDYNAIHVVDEFGQELKEYIRGLDPEQNRR